MLWLASTKPNPWSVLQFLHFVSCSFTSQSSWPQDSVITLSSVESGVWRESDAVPCLVFVLWNEWKVDGLDEIDDLTIY